MIIPALLTTEPRIAQERLNVAQHMSGWVHIDLLDKTLYDFDSLSLAELEQLDFGTVQLELHAMVNDPISVLDHDLPLGRVIIHYEISTRDHTYMTLVNKGVDTWIALDPSTPIDGLTLPDDLSGLLIMGVVPGQSGQSLLEATYQRLDQLKDAYPDIPLTVDGGVNQHTIRTLIAHGADNVVMGSALFQQPNPVEAYTRYVTLSDPPHGAAVPSTAT
jgi:ribulose-phosphate 3-epimerase